MKKTFFTAGRVKRTKNKSGSPHTSEHWSVDPKDLPDGYNVGSMSAPYTPPSASPKTKVVEKSHKRSKDHGRSQSPHSSLLTTQKSSPASAQLRKVYLKSSQAISSTKKEEWGKKIQRSCSFDDVLNQAGSDEIKEKPEEKVVKGQVRQVRRHSTDTEISVKNPAKYSRWASHHPESKWEEVKKDDFLPTSAYHGYSNAEARLLAAATMDRKMTSVIPQKALHHPKSVEDLLELVQSSHVDMNQLDDVTGEAPIHSIVRRKKKSHEDILLALLIHSDVDVNVESRKKKTALHVAIDVGCETCARILIIFGADINRQTSNQFTPLDLVINNGRMSIVESILLDLGAKGGAQQMSDRQRKVPRLFSFAEKLRPPKRGERLSTKDNLSEFVKRRGTNQLYQELEINVNRRMSLSATIGGADETFVLVLQQRELALFNRTLRKSQAAFTTGYGLRGGSRLLFLDGGGIKGLSQLEVLIHMEEKAQCGIGDLFDWIIGTSTGGIIALVLVYAKKSLASLRQMYFLLKDRIFMKSHHGYGYNSENWEDILKDYLNPDMKMSDVTHPKVLIAAVNKATTNLELRFFNNCFGDDYVDHPVWKVARYTSAAPMFFGEFENYVDGGVICNNPTDYGLTAVQNFCRLQGYRLSIAVVVSIGTGVYPAEKIGSVDAQEALYFGKQWLKPTKLIKQTQNLLSLLSNALVESELVAENSKSRCKEQGIPFFRFSPKLDEIIAAGETENEKLFNMIIKTKLYLKDEEKRLQDMISIFHSIAECSDNLNDASEPKQEFHAEPIATIQEEAEEKIPQEGGSFPEEHQAAELPTIQITEEATEESDSVAQLPDSSKDKANEERLATDIFSNGSLIGSIEKEMGIMCLEEEDATTSSEKFPPSPRKEFDTASPHHLPTCPLDHSHTDEPENISLSHTNQNENEKGKVLYVPYKAGDNTVGTETLV